MNHYVGKVVTVIKTGQIGVITFVHSKYRFVSVKLKNYTSDFYPEEVI